MIPISGRRIRWSAEARNERMPTPMRIVRIAAMALALSAFCGGVSMAQEKQASAPASTPIGLTVGAKAPEFSLPDQFGHIQTLGHTESNETLKGSKGTVLLFFRSADW